MRKFVITALVSACLAANAQAGVVLNSLLTPPTTNTLKDTSVGAVALGGDSTKIETSAAVIANGGALSVGDVIFGAISIKNQTSPGAIGPISDNLIALYSMTVVKAGDLTDNGVTTFAPTASSSALSVFSLLSHSIQTASGLGTVSSPAWDNVGAAVIENTSTLNPINDVTGTALSIAQAIGGAVPDATLAAPSSLDFLLGFSSLPNDFYNAQATGVVPAVGANFANVLAGFDVIGNNVSDVTLGKVPAQAFNQLTPFPPLLPPLPVDVAVSAATITYTNNTIWSYSDGASITLDPLSIVPEPGSVIVWSLGALGLCFPAVRRRLIGR